MSGAQNLDSTHSNGPDRASQNEIGDEIGLSRLAVLEEIIAHQQRTIDELSDQLTEQWKIVDHLRHKVDRLMERFQTLESQSLDAPANTPPPHY